MKQASLNPLKWVPSVYFAMGMPFVVLNLVAALMFRKLGISDTMIAFWTSLIILPWSLKPFWSPLLEMFKTKKFFVVGTQIVSGVLFGLVAFSLQLPDFFPYAISLMALIAFSGATHDIATDGIYITVLNKDQQAKFIGWQGAFYNMAKVMATGGLVYLAGVLQDRVGVITSWSVVMGICGAILFGLGLYHLRMLPSGGAATAHAANVREGMRETFVIFAEFFRKKFIWYYVAFIIFYRFAEGFVIKIVPLFLEAPLAEQGMGLSVQQIGLFYGTFGVVAFILGSIMGGYFISWAGLKKALFPLCCIFNIPFVVYALLSHYQPTSPVLIGGAIVFEYFGYGFGFVGLMLFIMQQVAPGKHQMAHYAFASALANLGVMLPGMVSGLFSDAVGYRDFFMWALLAAVPAFFLCYFIPFTHPDNKESNQRLERAELAAQTTEQEIE